MFSFKDTEERDLLIKEYLISFQKIGITNLDNIYIANKGGYFQDLLKEIEDLHFEILYLFITEPKPIKVIVDRKEFNAFQKNRISLNEKQKEALYEYFALRGPGFPTFHMDSSCIVASYCLSDKAGIRIAFGGERKSSLYVYYDTVDNESINHFLEEKGIDVIKKYPVKKAPKKIVKVANTEVTKENNPELYNSIFKYILMQYSNSDFLEDVKIRKITKNTFEVSCEVRDKNDTLIDAINENITLDQLESVTLLEEITKESDKDLYSIISAQVKNINPARMVSIDKIFKISEEEYRVHYNYFLSENELEKNTTIVKHSEIEEYIKTRNKNMINSAILIYGGVSQASISYALFGDKADKIYYKPYDPTGNGNNYIYVFGDEIKIVPEEKVKEVTETVNHLIELAKMGAYAAGDNSDFTDYQINNLIDAFKEKNLLKGYNITSK